MEIVIIVNLLLRDQTGRLAFGPHSLQVSASVGYIETNVVNIVQHAQHTLQKNVMVTSI